MSRVLLIDAGNTRLKWALLEGEDLDAFQGEMYADLSGAQFRARVLTPAGRIDRVVVANVGGERVASLIGEALRDNSLAAELTAEFVQPARRGGGIENGYRDPLQLGADRWAAMIGARALQLRPLCVVSVGTAMTLDGVDASGRHLGGVIVPGPELMVASLMRNTSDIAVRAQQGSLGDGLFADNTLGGVHQGAVHALAALIDHALQVMLAQCGESPVLIMTGGAVNRIEPHLKKPVLVVPDLVLKGLAVIAGATLSPASNSRPASIG